MWLVQREKKGKSKTAKTNKGRKRKSTKGQRETLVCLFSVWAIQKSDKQVPSKALPPPLPSPQT